MVGVVIARRVIDLDFWQFEEGSGRTIDREDDLRIVRFFVGVEQGKGIIGLGHQFAIS